MAAGAGGGRVRADLRAHRPGPCRNIARRGDYAQARGWEGVLEPDFDRAIEVASRLAATVLVTGSFHTVGDAMARLQVDPLAG